MDIHHSYGSKGNGISTLREELGYEDIIVFGDGDNDLSMFAVADEAYATANADDEVKALATRVIGHHDEDGVAQFLRDRFNL
jgi:hydroxymethylpyrimidine pyrophosphatase-like HAD family hydrolase